MFPLHHLLHRLQPSRDFLAVQVQQLVQTPAGVMREGYADFARVAGAEDKKAR